MEDNAPDVRLVVEAFRCFERPVNLQVVSDGEAALDFLYQRGPFANAPRPALVILDLNLPRRNGREILAEIRQDPQLGGVPIVVFSSSTAPDDKRAAYELGARSYVTKPLFLDEYVACLHAIARLWLEDDA